MALYDKASLVLIPSGTKEGVVFSQKPTNGDGDFTFTRASSATRVNSDGLIEKETQNLLLQSNTFTSTWTVYTGITFTSGQSGYNGTNDAWKLDKDASQFLAIRQTPTYSGVVTFSIYAKEGTLRYLNFYHPSTTAQIWFDLQAGAVGVQAGTYIENKIEDVGSGWYRCSVTYNASSGGELRIYPSSADGAYTAVAGNIYIQDAQLNQGLVADSYLETTTTAVYGGITDNVPRLDYTDSSCPALLLEPQRTNAMVNSEYFGAWISLNCTLSANNAISPEGVQNAYLITTTSTNETGVYEIISISGTHTFSAYAKAGTGRYLLFNTDASNQLAKFDLQDGSIVGTSGGNVTASIEDAGDGWYRCIVVSTNASSNRYTLFMTNNTSVADFGSASGLTYYLYGAQLEEGYATSYIPTYGTSVTRNADSASKTGISSLIGQTEGTIFVDLAGFDGNTHLVTLGDGTVSNYLMLYISSGSIAWLSNSGLSGSAGSVTATSKVALAYKENDSVLYLDGTQVLSDTSNTIPSLPNMYLNNNATLSNVLRLEAKQVTLFKTRLSNEELEALTTL